MVRVVAAMKIYNEIWHIEKTVRDIIDMVDHIIFIDGAWQHYPGGTPKSTDGTREFFEGLRDSGVSIEIHDNGDSLWDNQPQARSQYFRHGHPGDWLFLVDGDYEIGCSSNLKDWIEDNVSESTNSILVPFINDVDFTMCYFPLILKWEPGITYHNNHYSLFIGDEKRPMMAIRTPIMTIHHIHKTKPKEKIDGMIEYSKWRRDKSWKED